LNGSTTIGATAVSGDTYSWTSNPSGYSSSNSNPSVSPTTTSTYYLTEKITTTGCTKSDSIIITVNQLPAANVGSSSAICLNGSVSIGTASISGDSYSWISNPSGYTSTASNPSVSPTATTSYYLTEKITASGCTKSDSIVITVNPLPVAYTGSNVAICFNGNSSIGGKAVNGDTYSWTSNPSGYSSSTSNPSVSPTTTTTYYLTEKITATGCTKSDSIVITVNPLPSANAGSNNAICLNGSISVGATAVIGDTHSWTSNPNGFTSTSSNPTISPTTTTTYYLTEKITATSCTKSDSVIITVNPLPVAYTGNNVAICFGGNTSIGGKIVNGNTFSWTSNPNGYTSTSSNPTVSPTSTTTYYLAEKITSTGCSKSDSVVITVNALPAAYTGNNVAICFGGNDSIGGKTVIGNTYSWVSNPIGFTSTVSNPLVNPTITTSYYLTEKITVSGCSKSDSILITVNPVPAANPGANSAICDGGSDSIGGKAVSGNTYSWTSKPSGFTDSISNPHIKPSVTTTYYLTERITASGCTKSDSAEVTVNPLPVASIIKAATSSCAKSIVNYKAPSATNTAYTWAVQNGTIMSGQGTDSVIVSWGDTAGIVSLVEQNATNCRDSVADNITILALTVSSISGPVTSCTNNSGVYSAAYTVGHIYKWSVSGGNIVTGQNADTVTVMWIASGSDSIFVHETNGNNCSDSASLAIVVTATPVQPVISPGTADTLIASQGNATSYQWYLNGTAISGANADKYKAISSGGYTVEANNGVCASAISSPYNFTGIGSTDNIITSFKLYPNPANTTINIDASFAKPTTIVVELLNTLGQLIIQLNPRRVNAGEYNNSIYVGDLARGMYYLKVTTESGQIVQRIMKD